MMFFQNVWVKRISIGIGAMGIVIGLFFLIDSRTSWFSQAGDYAAEADSVQHVEREIILACFYAWHGCKRFTCGGR
jgi:hypothetical protein